jgi:hypothetical protein
MFALCDMECGPFTVIFLYYQINIRNMSLADCLWKIAEEKRENFRVDCERTNQLPTSNELSDRRYGDVTRVLTECAHLGARVVELRDYFKPHARADLRQRLERDGIKTAYDRSDPEDYRIIVTWIPNVVIYDRPPPFWISIRDSWRRIRGVNIAVCREGVQGPETTRS